MAFTATTDQLIQCIRERFLNQLTAIPGRAAFPGAPGMPAIPGEATRMKTPWNPSQFVKLATGTAPAGTGIAVAAIPAGTIPPAAPPVWADYAVDRYDETRNLKTPPGGAAPALTVGKKMVQEAILTGDFRLLHGDPLYIAAVGAGSAPRMRALVFASMGSRIDRLINNIISISDYTLSKSKKFIYNLPKSDELLLRFITPLYLQGVGMSINISAFTNPELNAVANVIENGIIGAGPAGLILAAAAAAAKRAIINTAMTAAAPNANQLLIKNFVLSLQIGKIIMGYMENNMYKQISQTEFETYKAMLNLTPQDIEALNKYDERVDQIHEALSKNIDINPTTTIIPTSMMIQNTNKIITKYLIPKQIQDVLIDKRKNIQPSLNHLTVSINSGSTNMRGGSNKNNTLALYPKITMNGGSHPYASLDGGAWNPSRGSPNPVATLDARIKSLEAEFKSVTGKNLGPLSGDLRRHADNLNTTIGQVQNSLQVLSSATEELNRHPVGLGIDASTFNEAKLREIASHAEEYNKNLTKASKQINTLDRAANMLEELVSRSRPAART